MVAWPSVRSLGLSILLAVLATAPSAVANGRFPRGERLLEDPSDANHLVLAATYGLLVTRDRGASWYHVCEGAFAELSAEADPVAAFTTDGSLITSLNSSLSRSSADACNFELTLGRGKAQIVPDFTVQAQHPDQAVAVVAEVDNGQVTSYRLHGSDDGGQHWAPFGAVLPDAIKLVATVDVAPSDPARIYVSGLGAGNVGLLLRSDDHGASFSVIELPTAAADTETPYIAAVAPAQADTLYVRTDVWVYEPATGISWARDALLYSDDAGEHFTELIRASGKLLGFALSPDGTQLLLGYADPVEGQGRLVEPDALGIYRGEPGVGNFEHVFGGSTSCLTWTENAIYACTSQAELGFALATVDAASLVPNEFPTFQPLLDVFDVRGPLGCSVCSSVGACAEAWQATCLGWGRDDCEDSALAPFSEGCGGDGSGGSGGEPDASSAGAPAGGQAESDESGTHGGRSVITAGKSSTGKVEGAGCSCKTAAPLPAPQAAGLLMLLGAWRLRRRDKRQFP